MQESYVVRRMLWQWIVYHGPKWAARTLARWLGVHHHYVQKLVEEFKSDPARMWREVRAEPLHGSDIRAIATDASEHAADEGERLVAPVRMES